MARLSRPLRWIWCCKYKKSKQRNGRTSCRMDITRIKGLIYTFRLMYTLQSSYPQGRWWLKSQVNHSHYFKEQCRHTSAPRGINWNIIESSRGINIGRSPCEPVNRAQTWYWTIQKNALPQSDILFRAPWWPVIMSLPTLSNTVTYAGLPSGVK